MSSSTQPITKKAGGLSFTFQPGSGKVPTKGRLTAALDDKNIKVDSFDIAKENLRKSFIGELRKDFPDLIPPDSYGDVENCLMDFASTKFEVDTTELQENKSAEAKGVSISAQDKPHYMAAWDMLESDDLFEQIKQDVKDLGVVGEEDENITIYIVMTSRHLHKPIAAIVQGASSSGKSFKIETVASMIPAEGKVVAHDFSEHALEYLAPGSLKHKVIICGERLHSKKGTEGHAEENTKAFREMIASGRYVREVVEKNNVGKFGTRHIEQEGPIAYIESTTADWIPDEDSTRLIKLSSDETEEQTHRIQELQKQEAKGEIASAEKRNAIINKHHALQRLLARGVKEPPKIIIPFIDHVTLPEKVVSTRRTFQYVVSIIQTVAFIRQYQHSKTGGVSPDWEQRSKDGKIVITADREDYRIAYDIVHPILEKTYGSLPTGAKELLSIIKDNTTGKPIVLADGRKVKSQSGVWSDFTASDCEKWTGVKKSEAWRRLKSLEFAGIISCNRDAKQHKFKIANPDLIESVDILSAALPIPDKMDLLIDGKGVNDSCQR